MLSPIIIIGYNFRTTNKVVALTVVEYFVTTLLLTFIAGTTHIAWGQQLKSISQVCQITIVTNALNDMVKSLKSQLGEQGTYILCGDFNIEPQSPAYQLLQEGELTNKEMIRLKGVDYIRWGPDSPAPSQVLYVIYL